MERSGLAFRLTLTLAVIALVAVGGILAILPYGLYQRDIRLAATHAHRVSAVVQAALDCPLREGDPGVLVERVRTLGDVEIALTRMEAGALPPGAVVGRGSSVLDDTDLRYVSAPVTARDGESWVAQLRFDLSEMKRESLRLVLEVVLAVLVGALVFSIAIFWLLRGAVLLPLRDLTRAAERLAAGETDVRMPQAEVAELRDLARAIDRLRTR